MKKVLLLLLILLIFCGCNKNNTVDNSNEDQIVEEFHEEKTEDVSNKEQSIEEHNEEKVEDDSYAFVNIDTAINEHECQYSFDDILNNYKSIDLIHIDEKQELDETFFEYTYDHYINAKDQNGNKYSFYIPDYLGWPLGIFEGIYGYYSGEKYRVYYIDDYSSDDVYSAKVICIQYEDSVDYRDDWFENIKTKYQETDKEKYCCPEMVIMQTIKYLEPDCDVLKMKTKNDLPIYYVNDSVPGKLFCFNRIDVNDDGELYFTVSGEGVTDIYPSKGEYKHIVFDQKIIERKNKSL